MAKFPAPKTGDTLVVVPRYRKGTPASVRITKVGRLYVHLASTEIPLQHLVDFGVYHGQNESYWLSASLYETYRTNKILLDQLEARIATVVPQNMRTSDILEAARLLGVELIPKP